MRRAAKESEIIQKFRQVRFEAFPENEPLKYLETRRLEYIKRMELIADEARENGMPELELKACAFLTRLTSVWKTKVDVNAGNLGLVKAPALTALTDEQLRRVEAGDDSILAEVATDEPT